MAKRIFASSAWHLTAVKDMAHRRLKVAQLTTLISHRTVRFSPHSGSGVACGAHGKALARGFQLLRRHALHDGQLNACSSQARISEYEGAAA